MQSNIEIIKISAVGPYGVKVGNTWYKLNKGVEPSAFTNGNTYSVSVNAGQKGGKYINRIENNMGVLHVDVGQPSAPLLDTNTNKAPDVSGPRRAGFGQPLTQYDLDTQHEIRRSGLIQAAMNAVASHVPNVDKLISESQRVAEAQEQWVVKH